jgi:hypothetical protein
MYCSLDDAYNTASDLLQSRQDCVYDNIVKDDMSMMEQCRPTDMFTAQGEFKPYSALGEVNNMCGTTIKQFEQPDELGGTPIDLLQPKQQTTQRNHAPISASDNNVPEYAFDKSHKHFSEKSKCKEDPKKAVSEPSKTLHNKTLFQLSGEKSGSRDVSSSLTPNEEDQIRYIVNESFQDMLAKNKMQKQIHKQSRKSNWLSPDYRDGILITFIGVLILFILDILVRISKKL